MPWSQPHRGIVDEGGLKGRKRRLAEMTAVSRVRRDDRWLRIAEEDRLYDLAGWITERDRMICRLLYDHQVLTTSQVADIGFGSLRRAQQRLAALYAAEVVDRFRPRSWSGSGPHHLVLGRAGARVIAAERGMALSELHWHRDAGETLAISSQLAHLFGCNGFFTSLMRQARMRGDAELAEWWPERRCAAAWGQAVIPDAYAIWVEGAQRLPFLFEFDRGTERLSRLEAKLPGYAALARAAKHPTWVLFCFPSQGREAAARRVLVHPEVPVATAALEPGQAPDDAVWLAVGDMGPRRRLADLGHPARVLELTRPR
jgi:hypothetical protein